MLGEGRKNGPVDRNRNSHNFLWELLFKNVSQRDIQIFEESMDFRAMTTRVTFLWEIVGKMWEPFLQRLKTLHEFMFMEITKYFP